MHIHTKIHDKEPHFLAWRRAERILLALFVLSRLDLFWSRFNVAYAFDGFFHMEMLQILSWTAPSVDMHTFFYGYHPPLAFLLPRSIMLLGTSDVVAVQIVNLIATFIAFWFVRETLLRLHLLWRPSGIAMLYLSATIPLHLFLVYGIQMESIVMACTSVVLFCSIGLFWKQQGIEHAKHPKTLALGLLAALLIGMLTKFNAIFLFSIPVFVAFANGGFKQRIRLSLAASSVAVTAGLIALPFYTVRYYIPEGTFFPSNTDVFDIVEQTGAREARDMDRIGFFKNMFLETEVHAESVAYRDLGIPRLADTWKDFWVMDDRLGRQTDTSMRYSLFYMTVAPWLLITGLLGYLWLLKKRTAWARLGSILIPFGLLQVLTLIAYVYKNPWAGSYANKAIYIAPALLTMGYLAATNLELKAIMPRFIHRHWYVLEWISFACVTAFVLVNHLTPVY